MKGSVTGMDQVFGGEPEYSGFRPPAGSDATAAADEKTQFSPPALVGFAAIIIGVGLGVGRRGQPRARWISGAVASGIALTAVVVNQVMIHRRVQEALDHAASSFRSQAASVPMFGLSIPVPAFELGDEPGFWVVTVLLGLVVGYNLFEAVALQRRPNQLPSFASDGTGAPETVPLPRTDNRALGWPQNRPPRHPADDVQHPLQQPPTTTDYPSRYHQSDS